jgi:hypothetical protein
MARFIRQSKFRTTAALGFAACFFTFMIGLVSAPRADEPKAPSKLYELRFYKANPGKLEALHTRFRDHTLKLFEKHGMENIIYWNVIEGTKQDGEDALNMMIYVIAHKDEAAREASWKAFMDDPEWKEVYAKSEEGGKILAEAPKSILMRDVDFSPADDVFTTDASESRIYELRQYNDGAARVPFTVDRFGSGEVELFTQAGMQTLKFWRASDDSAFIYLLGHKDREAAKSSWGSFMTSFKPFMDKYLAGGKAPKDDLPKGSGIEARYLKTTDYSPKK